MTSIPTSIKAMGYKTAGCQAELMEYPAKPMAKHDLDMAVLYTGVCHTDIHMIDNDWKVGRYPLVPGHEVVGRVLAVGSEVKEFKAGDIVGLGAMAQACFECNACTRGYDNLCTDTTKKTLTYTLSSKDETGEHPHHGGFSSFLRTDSRLLFNIPAGYSLPHAGPLLCAGATVGAPLLDFCDGKFEAKGKRIGIVGIGGLGHLGVQIAAKMDAEVYALSRGTGKMELAKQMGAKGLVDTTNAEEMKKYTEFFDMLLVTAPGGKLNVEFYTPLLRVYGNLHFVGIPDEVENIKPFTLVAKRLSISSSYVASKPQLQKILDFCSIKDIKPLIEMFKHSEANQAVQKIRDGSIRFRAVLENDLVASQ